ncbi:MAG: NAD(P)(+) transhydrogenase (Re/Si-specific) subunit beta [Deltaproteobacteria bacterium]|nr:NAD(P)(+) transhydrogenase (Re/Si-specific) subunit beta [Deltaproteobacteria bacterium]
MELQVDHIVAAIVILLFLGGIALFRGPRTARLGGWLNILAYAGAVAFIMIRYPTLFPEFILIAVLIGGTVGAALAVKVRMIDVPQMVAFQHGCGGVAAFLIAFSEYVMGGADLAAIAQFGSVLGIVVGAVTFSGSLIAAGKLAKVIEQRPVLLAKHSQILLGLSAITIILCVFSLLKIGLPVGIGLAVTLIVISIIGGVIFTIRIGGADMPVIISFFNATAGFAASFVGIALSNYLLIGCGACVAASGSLLTLSMCKAMNRSVINVLSGSKRTISRPVQEAAGQALPVKAASIEASPFDRAIASLNGARDVVIVPGYGMALSQAQGLVHDLERLFEGRGANVRYAIHPVAGRMPGHMNVLLADVGVEYDKLFELDKINDEFKKADLAIVVGACDVVNPAATTQQDTPISGMPILNAHEAKSVIVLNWDEKPGFSGVDNPLYGMEQAILMWGDAKENLGKLLSSLQSDKLV